MNQTQHECDWCGARAETPCPDPQCPSWLCDACADVYLFCQDHTDLARPDPELTAEVNRLLAVAEVACRQGMTCPMCRTGELQMEETLRHSDTLHAIAQMRVLKCAHCHTMAPGSVRWSRIGPSAFTAERLQRWKIQVGALEMDARLSGHIFDVLLGQELAGEFRQTLAAVKDQLYAHTIENNEV
ncbi:MAG: hypothetical protein ACE5LU_06050 [Anaerolineae bacterium]